MDLSSLPQREQEQLQQLHQQFKEHQAQQQQQQQQYQHYQQQQQYQDYSYDPTQAQSYDPSTQPYYSSYYQQPNQQQHYAYYNQYYNQDYSAYQQPPHPHPASIPINQPDLPVPNEPAQAAKAGRVGDLAHHNAYYSGLNPAAAAAVAALSQLTQFARTMDAAERAMGGGLGPMTGPTHFGPGSMPRPVPYVGSGRRGGRGGPPFRGVGRGNSEHWHPRSGGFGLPFGGKGRNWGRGGHRRFPPLGSSSSSHPERSTALDAESTDEDAEPSANLPEEADQSVVPPEASQSAPATGKVASKRRPPKSAWCELCRVDCTSLEILEQHKNGKRHKKNMQRIEELKIVVKPVVETQNQQKPVAISEPEVYHQTEKKAAESVFAEVVNDESKLDSEQQINTDKQSEVTAESSKMQAGKARSDRFDNQRRGVKRKMKGGLGGKRKKTFEVPRRPNEPLKSKVVIPLICDLCNVKCDTQEVFDRHLSGKKHMAKLKRFEGHQAMYGPLGLQALYPPNPIARTLFLPQGHQQQIYGPQGSNPSSGAPQTDQAPPSPSLNLPHQQISNPQYLGVASDVASHGVALAP
ncbi:zf-met domain-containing protein [Cephalotus follicularis]|uniref:Zf-met domain-containing protein n=1 Tax=Cephalotus follicularis TaxID=3775 RepID=A0A1Q3D7A8_CEPFO|nr:zf-met domain-containing protein [Cephalotus follicularis]